MPENARTDDQGLRWYRWEPTDGSPPTDVLSVTSVRKACGVSINLVNWQIANIINAASGTRRVEKIGPRGGVKQVYRPDGEFPGEFTRQLIATGGEEAAIARVRGWLKDAGDSPRDTAAMRGTIVHAAIERNEAEPSTEWIRQEYEHEAESRRRRSKLIVTDDDINFIKRCAEQYGDFRQQVPLVILASESQLWNLSLGVAGSADAIGGIAGEPGLIIFDWKTSAGLHADQVCQVTGYMQMEFAGANGVKDEAVTAMLSQVTRGGLVHIRPDGWSLHLFPFMTEVALAFTGSVLLARLLADHGDPKALFTESRSGKVDK